MNRFSILLPVRNGGELVKKCVHSILQQTITDFDLLVLDNCSTDGTSQWIQNINDKRVFVFPAEQSLSIEENWGRAVLIPKNEFITIIGHDDLLDQTYLEEMDKLIKANPNATLYQSHFRFINTGGSEIGKCRTMRGLYDAAEYLEAILSDSIDTMGTGYMMRSKDYDNIGGIPSYPNLLYADHALWIKLTSLGYLAVSDKECFSYRINQSVSKLSNASKYIDAFLLFLNFLASLKPINTTFGKVITARLPAYIQFYCKALSHRLLKTPLNERNNKNVSGFIAACTKKAIELGVEDRFRPMKDPSIRLAKLIDSTLLTRNLYLLFRQFYSKPFYP